MSGYIKNGFNVFAGSRIIIFIIKFEDIITDGNDTLYLTDKPSNLKPPSII